MFIKAAGSGEFGMAGDRQAKLLAVNPEIDRKGHAACPVGIQPQREGIKPVPDRQCRRQVRISPTRHGKRGDAAFEFGRACEVDVPHDPRFGAESHMPVDKRQHRRGILRRAAGKHQMREQRSGPLQVVVLDCLCRDRDGGVGSADRCHDALPHGFGRQRVQIDRIAVEKAVIALVYGPDVEGQRAVIAAAVEGSGQPVRLFNLRRDLVRGQAGIGEAQRLVVNIFVDVALLFQIRQSSSRPHTGQLWQLIRQSA